MSWISLHGMINNSYSLGQKPVTRYFKHNILFKAFLLRLKVKLCRKCAEARLGPRLLQINKPGIFFFYSPETGLHLKELRTELSHLHLLPAQLLKLRKSYFDDENQRRRKPDPTFHFNGFESNRTIMKYLPKRLHQKKTFCQN